MLGGEQRVINKHMLAEVFFYHTRETKADSIEMSNVIITLVDIVDRILDIYNTNEGWVVKKMKSKYVN
jgi:hypothetical protein